MGRQYGGHTVGEEMPGGGGGGGGGGGSSQGMCGCDCANLLHFCLICLLFLLTLLCSSLHLLGGELAGEGARGHTGATGTRLPDSLTRQLTFRVKSVSAGEMNDRPSVTLGLATLVDTPQPPSHTAYLLASVAA